MATLVLLHNARISTLTGARLQEAVATTAAGRPFAYAWSIGSARRAEAGDRVFLYAQGDSHALFASGHVAGDERTVPVGDERRRARDVAWDVVLPVEDGVPEHVLAARVPGEPWRARYAGRAVRSAADAAALEQLWEEHLALRRQDLPDPR